MGDEHNDYIHDHEDDHDDHDHGDEDTDCHDGDDDENAWLWTYLTVHWRRGDITQQAAR